MELHKFVHMMQQKSAQQVIIAPNQPLRILSGGNWQEASTFTPTEHAINRMLREAVPPSFQDGMTQNNITFSFPYQTASGQYQVEVQSVLGQRTVTISDSSASAKIAPPAPVATPPQQFSSDGSSALSGSRASSQIAREMGKGSVNITTPSTPSVPSAAPAPVPRTPAAPAPGTSAPTPPAYGAPPVLPEMAWHYAVNGRQFGPVPQPNVQAAIAQGLITAETMVWREGMPDWAMAKLTELESLFRSQPPSVMNFVETRTHEGSSGQGEYATVPNELHGWNWGAFLFPVFWALAHNMWGWALGIFLSGLIPYIGWLVSIALTCSMAGQGYELAWKNRRWNSVDHCLQVQQIWQQAGIIIWATVLVVAAVFFFAMMNV